MKKVLIITLTFLCFIITAKTNAQGCSDAGFCTAGGLSPQIISDTLGEEHQYKNNFKFSPSFAMGEQGVTIWQYTPELNLTVVKGLSWQVKMPYMYAYGNLGSNYGIGDVTTSLTYTTYFDKSSALSVTLGSKIPVHDANACQNGRPLPMPYQRSLGTFDGILGVKYKYKTWNFAVGYQRVLINKNENGFLPSKWAGDTDAPDYFWSNKLDRGDDALLRAEKVFMIKKFNLSAGLLSIYRLNKDKYIEANGTEQKLNGSSGLTINVTGSATYIFTPRSSFGLNFGSPLLVRETRADGLTRSMVLSLVYQVNFNFKK